MCRDPLGLAAWHTLEGPAVLTVVAAPDASEFWLGVVLLLALFVGVMTALSCLFAAVWAFSDWWDRRASGDVFAADTEAAHDEAIALVDDDWQAWRRELTEGQQ